MIDLMFVATISCVQTESSPGQCILQACHKHENVLITVLLILNCFGVRPIQDQRSKANEPSLAERTATYSRKSNETA